MDPQDFDINDAQYVQHMFEVLATMTATASVTRVPTYGGHWVVTGYDAVREASTNWEAFTSTQGVMHPNEHGLKRMPPITEDPPLHRAYRKVLNPFFSKNTMTALEANIRRHADDLIDAFVENGSADMHSQYAAQLPSEVFFSDLLHVPEQLRDRFMHAFTGPLMGGHGRSDGILAMSRELVAARRDAPPLDDVVDALFATELDGEPLTTEQVVQVVMILLIGGTATTANTIGSGLYLIATDDRLRTIVAAGGAPLDTAVEEILRAFGAVQFAGRTATHDATIAGVHIAAGDKVMISFAGANRDPAEFPNAATFVPDREPNRHVAFGVGVHRCIGSHLARLQIRIALEQAVARLPDFRMVDDYEFERKAGHMHGATRLPVRFTAGRRR